MKYRLEKDFLGEIEVPDDAYWGIHTARAIGNFNFSALHVNASLITALAVVKKACCAANRELGYLDEAISGAITRACDEIIGGRFIEQFPLDALQGGAGTSTHMNINEVIANRALEIVGKEKGDYDIIHPLHHVNLHQSTNDVYPTALRVASIGRLRVLAEAVASLQGAFQKKERDFATIVTMGRTELVEAVPVTLGAQFSAFSEALSRDRWRVFKCEERLRVVNLGGTAVGTGLAAPRSYIFLAVEKLRELTGFGISRGENLMGETANQDPFVEVSGIIKAHSATILKISQDLRLLALLGEIRLPSVQAGSSIMPGKVNPVILEGAMQCALKVIANDLMITEAASRASLQICEFIPLLAHALLESFDILINLNNTMASHIEAIEADAGHCRRYVDMSPMTITAFLPQLGYEKALQLLEEFRAGRTHDLADFLRARLGAELVEKVLSPHNLTSLGYRGDE
ncbi:MAG: aspartate ammonia-lyase [Candidatus Xenobiia bacterium LiM19]